MADIALPIQRSRTIGATITARLPELAEAVVDRHFAAYPEVAEVYDARGRALYVRDMHFNLQYLAQALALADPKLFLDYVAWMKVLLTSHGVREIDVRNNLQLTAAVLEDVLSRSESEMALQLLDTAVERFPDMPVATRSHIVANGVHSQIARRYLDHLLAGEDEAARRLIIDHLESDASLEAVYLEVIEPVQREAGRLWQTGRIDVAQEHHLTAATRELIAYLHQRSVRRAAEGPRILLAGIEDETHGMGLQVLNNLFEQHGWRVHNLGPDTPNRAVLQAMHRFAPDIVALSATIACRLSQLSDLIDTIRSTNMFGDVKIIVGGYPFRSSPLLWQWVGADGTARDGAEAIALADGLIADRYPDRTDDDSPET